VALWDHYWDQKGAPISGVILTIVVVAWTLLAVLITGTIVVGLAISLISNSTITANEKPGSGANRLPGSNSRASRDLGGDDIVPCNGARLVLSDPHVVGAQDCLFEGTPSQTFWSRP
jgi:hypothetical protein